MYARALSRRVRRQLARLAFAHAGCALAVTSLSSSNLSNSGKRNPVASSQWLSSVRGSDRRSFGEFAVGQGAGPRLRHLQRLGLWWQAATREYGGACPSRVAVVHQLRRRTLGR